MYDIIIIGSGAAGLSAAVYAQREQLKNIVIEKEYMGTGQISKSERVDNYLGLYGESGYQLGEKFREHALSLGTEFVEGEVTKIVPFGNIYKAELSNGKVFETKTIIYALGTNQRKLDIKGENEFLGKGVSYCAVCDGAFYKDKIAAVVGGGDTALGDALLLSKAAKKVYIIYRRDKFRANKILQSKVKNSANIELILNAVTIEILGDKKVSSVKIYQNGNEKIINIDGIFAAIGGKPNSALITDIVKLDKNGYVIADENGITCANGIFAAGDVRTKNLRQVVTAVSDGANCVLSAERYIEKNF